MSGLPNRTTGKEDYQRITNAFRYLVGTMYACPCTMLRVRAVPDRTVGIEDYQGSTKALQYLVHLSVYHA